MQRLFLVDWGMLAAVLSRTAPQKRRDEIPTTTTLLLHYLTPVSDLPRTTVSSSVSMMSDKELQENVESMQV